MPVVKPPSDNIAMIALRGNKKRFATFQRLINRIQHKIYQTIKDLKMPQDSFVPYKIEQIHATIIGMEVIKIAGELYNANFLNNDGRLRKIEANRLLTLMDTIQKTKDPNAFLTIRFGGFRKTYCRCEGFDLLDWNCPTGSSEFHAFNRTAYEGSFYAFSGGPVMLTGWPVDSAEKKSTFNRDLFGVRRAAGGFGFLDKYHLQVKPHWKDDDFFVRLGSFRPVDDPLKPSLISLIERVRDFLCLEGPVIVDIPVEAISIVYYEDPSLDRIKNGDPKNEIPLRNAIDNPGLVDDLYAYWTIVH